MTTEAEFVEIRRRMEMLKLARHLLNEDYLKQRAAAYTQWTTDSDHAWKTRGVKLPFPPVPAMPSEADVVARALQLYNHVNAQAAPASPAPAAAPAVSTPQPEVATVAATSVPAAEPEPVIEPEPMAEPEPEPTPEPVVAPEPTPEPTPEPIPEPVSVPVPAIETVLPVSRPETVYTEQVKKIFETPSPAIDPPLDQAVESLVQAETENNRALVPMIRGLIEKGFLQLGHRLGQNKTNKKETD
jgi:hypothetical protein